MAMRSLLAILASLLALNAPAQILPVVNPSLRLIGTNLFDVSRAGPRFHVAGQVTAVYPQSMEVSLLTGEGFHIRTNLPAMNPGDTQGWLLLGAAERIGLNPDGTFKLISLGQYLTMSPNMQMLFEPAREYQRFYLIHAQYGSPGDTVSATAVPTTAYGFYDCGIQFTGDTNDFEYIYYLQGDQTVRKPVHASAASKN